ncbi:MAG: hypothetical protein ACYC6L_15725 [Anaerolineae bacterium]
MGSKMNIDSVYETPERTIVMTTGARYEFDKSSKRGEVSCYQRLNRERPVARITFGHAFRTLTVEHHDNESVVLNQIVQSTWYTKLVIRADGVLEIYSMPRLDLQFAGSFTPYVGQRDGSVLLLDETGGIGVYPSTRFNQRDATGLTSREWRLHYEGDMFCRMYVSVLPPRPYDWERSYKNRIAHWGVNPPWTFGHFPSDEMITKAAEYADILVLHDQIWLGKLTRQGIEPQTEEELTEDAAYCSYAYTAVDPQALTHVVQLAHQLGMKVLPYFSPTFSMSSGSEFLEMVERTLSQYGFDGVYFDGVTFDLYQAYELIRSARKMLGERILYIHTTWEPLMSRSVYCPFIDTYADFVLRGEHPADFDDEDYLHYVLSGYNTSNSVGLVCHCYYPASFVQRIITKTMTFNGRFYLALPETENEQVLKDDYLPALEAEGRERGHLD